jgi:hypothetical protein
VLAFVGLFVADLFYFFRVLVTSLGVGWCSTGGNPPSPSIEPESDVLRCGSPRKENGKITIRDATNNKLTIDQCNQSFADLLATIRLRLGAGPFPRQATLRFGQVYLTDVSKSLADYGIEPEPTLILSLGGLQGGLEGWNAVDECKQASETWEEPPMFFNGKPIMQGQFLSDEREDLKEILSIVQEASEGRLFPNKSANAKVASVHFTCKASRVFKSSVPADT